MDIPKIVSAQAQTDSLLLLKFSNGVEKIYDCKPLLNMERFALLQSAAFFRQVHVDTGGYGISWNDDIDLSEYELWTNGVVTNADVLVEK